MESETSEPVTTYDYDMKRLRISLSKKVKNNFI